ncbi:MAG: hypothetical protein PWR06_1383 [Thermoanaerobacteraceae bacterium]|jgi:hypothetical protein|nr:hypothetical protein [Thermoanaerobacteraceae bacterium]MDN5301262.1 hypothetical protein [Thermoanaerobacteraceae bacterium]MDN5313436.1 hypothetical protein [Thermoanaerobacteraceae bacterium]
MEKIEIDERAKKYIQDKKNDTITIKLERYGGG